MLHPWYRCAALLVWSWVCCATSVLAQDWHPLVDRAAEQLGAWSCAASNCHGGERQQLVPPQRSGGELEIYRSLDPHGRAGEILEGAKFAQILERLNIAVVKPAGQNPLRTQAQYEVKDAARLQECMNCHNPAEMQSRWSDAASHSVATFAIECETCHGPAKAWRETHTRPDWNRSEGLSQGFRDMKHLLTRGRACAQCHVGGANRDMNHDMIAAGHPPLRFELAAYMAKLPKHWHDRKARTLTPNLDLQLWLTGQVANLDSSLALLASRAQRASEPEPADNAAGSGLRSSAAWPELAEFSCTSCHQALTSPAEWDDAKHRHVVREHPLRWNAWNQGLLDLVDVPTSSPSKPAWHKQLRDLQTALEAGEYHDSTSLQQLIEQVQRLREGSPSSPGFQAFGSQLLRAMPLQPRLQVAVDQRLTQQWNEEQATHAYAYFVAKVQSQYDEAAKAYASPGVSPALLLSLRQMKTKLQPLPGRPFGPVANVWDREFTEHVQRAAKLVEGASQP
jgi:hypothetical protein